MGGEAERVEGRTDAWPKPGSMNVSHYACIRYHICGFKFLSLIWSILFSFRV